MALIVAMAPASGVDLTGSEAVQTYEGPQRFDVQAPKVNELARVEDFESHLTWAAGLDEKLAYSFSILSNPTRLVVDIHNEATVSLGTHDNGERVFAVSAFVADQGVCFVLAPGADDTGPVATSCETANESLHIRTVQADGLSALVGTINDPAVSDIDLIANDGSAIADEFEQFELVELTNGLLAFAPAADPEVISAIEAFSADGVLLHRVEV